MNIYDLTTEYQRDPIGMDILKPRFSWKIESDDKGVMQSAYQIIVSDNQGEIWNTQRIDKDDSVLVPYEGKELEPEKLYHITVKVHDNQGNQAVGEGTFETGILKGTNFKAKWITHELAQDETACAVFNKKFHIEKNVKMVRVYATALGIYEIKINEKKVGDTYLAPGWTNYKKRIQYQTYEADNYLKKENEIEITVANGWYKGYLSFTCTPNQYGDRTAALAEVHITYEDGSKEVILTDETWDVYTGAVKRAELYMGETYDSLEEKKLQGKSIAICKEEGVFDKTRLVSQESEPVRIKKRFPAMEYILTPKKEKVINFGQNIAGFVEVKVRGKKGQQIKIRHAETLDKHGNFYPDTLRAAISEDIFICDGSEQILIPSFTFHGFQYICVEGLDEICLEDFTACAIHTDMADTGSFLCSNVMVNQLQSNIYWGQSDNFVDIPTDCPQRDERLGWTGDAQVFSGTAVYLRNTARFFTKWLHDLASEQSEDGGVPHVVPDVLGSYSAAAWSDAATIIPWAIYETYGDKRILEDQYESMKGWVDYITNHTENNGLWMSDFQYGDWLALDKEEFVDRTGATDRYLIANSYYLYSTDIVKKSAMVLGKKEDAIKYGGLYDNILKAFRKEYFTSTGRMVGETQTALTLALHFNLAEEKNKQRIAKMLESNIGAHKNHLSTGFVGTPYICHALSDYNMHELAGALFLKEDFPSWLYSVKKGATTIWERWDSIKPNGDFDESGMNSLNHYAYGSIGEWMYKKLAGINPVTAGYKKLYIKPMFIKGITWVKASFESVYGCIQSEWECKNNRITVKVTIPPNTTASLYLPEKEGVIELGSGSYSYEYDTDTKLEIDRFTMETTLGEIAGEPVARQIIEQATPGFFDAPMIQYAYGLSLTELLTQAKPLEPVLKAVIDTLNQS